ncbi:MAG: hypothetical protein RLZZ543_605 [Bacteroidota bacterium]|jgi:opacity protein-like surface antigen
MKHLSITALLFCGSLLQAQSTLGDNKEVKKGIFTQSNYQLGVFFNAYAPVLTDYQLIQTLASSPADLNLPANIDAFTRRLDSQEGNQGTASVVLSTAFSPWSKKKEAYNKQHLLRVGLNFRDVNTYETSYNFAETITPDSSISRDYVVNANQKVLGVETMYSISTDAEKAVNVFVGLGLTAGYTVSSSLEVNSNLNIIKKQADGANATKFIPNNRIIKGKSAMYSGVFIPAGIHARVRKNVGVLAEFRYSMFNTSASNGGPKFSRNSIFAGIGIRYTFGVFESKGPALY